MSKQQRVLEAKAREVAQNYGCTAVKSTKRLPVSGGGGFQVIDSETCRVRAGQHFNLSAQDVINLFAGDAA